MDENIRPVFCVVHPEETHGVLFLQFEPREHGYNVFGDVGTERLVYTPKLNIPLTLFLKSWRYFDDRIRMDDYEPKDKRKFRNAVEKELKRRGIEFKLNWPTGFQKHGIWGI